MNSDRLKSQDFGRILLIQLSAFGDVIQTIPLLHELRRRYPAAQIDWLTKSAIAELIQHHTALDRVLVFHDDAWRRPLRPSAGALGKFWRLARELRAGHYDLVIDLHGQFRSAACAAVTSAPVRIGFDRPRAALTAASRKLPATAYRHGWTGAREFSWLAYTDTIPLETLDLHAVDRYLRVGLLLGFEPQPADFSFSIPDASKSRAADLLSRSGMQEHADFVLIAPSATWETKQWSPSGFAAVARHFVTQGTPVIVTGAKQDRAVCETVARDAPGVVNLCGQTSLSELAALTKRAALVISNDSGPMHLAVALGRPTVSIFGPTDPLWIGPYRRDGAVLSAELSCSPCYLRQLRRCPFDHACMKAIAPTDVIARAEQALGVLREPVPDRVVRVS